MELRSTKRQRRHAADGNAQRPTSQRPAQSATAAYAYRRCVRLCWRARPPQPALRIPVRDISAAGPEAVRVRCPLQLLAFKMSRLSGSGIRMLEALRRPAGGPTPPQTQFGTFLTRELVTRSARCAWRVLAARMSQTGRRAPGGAIANRPRRSDPRVGTLLPREAGSGPGTPVALQARKICPVLSVGRAVAFPRCERSLRRGCWRPVRSRS